MTSFLSLSSEDGDVKTQTTDMKQTKFLSLLIQAAVLPTQPICSLLQPTGTYLLFPLPSRVSDTHVLEVFDRYVKMDRLPLTDIISVDEVP